MSTTLLATRAMLCHPYIQSHSFQKRDHEAARTAAKEHGADPRRIKAFKALVPPHLLSPIQSNESRLRALVRQETLPWRWEGVALLPNKNYMRLLDRWNEAHDERIALVTKFQLTYREAHEQFTQELGSLGHDQEYPHPDSIPRRFKATLELFPIPQVEDFRTDLPQYEADAIRQEMASNEVATITQIQDDITGTLTSLVTRLLDALSNHAAGDSTSTLREPLLDTVKESLARLQRLNVLDDPHVDMVATSITRSLAGLSASDLREIAPLRAQTQHDIQAVLDTLFAPLPKAA